MFADWDTTAEWAKPFLAWCYEKGWLSGNRKGDKLYVMAAAPIIRAEAAALVGRTIGDKTSGKYIEFKDMDQIPSWAVDDVKLLSGLGILNGNPDKTFMPNNKMKRSEAACIFDNYLSTRALVD